MNNDDALNDAIATQHREEQTRYAWDPTVPRRWVFTFGMGQPQAGRFVELDGTYDEARTEMIKRFGRRWAFQYGSREEAGVERWGLTLLEAHATDLFLSINALYDARGGRASGESDMGVWWFEAGAAHRYPTFRVSVIHATGDVYAIRQSDGRVELLGTLPHNDRDGHVALEADRNFPPCDPASCAYDEADRVFKGWAAACGREPLSWFRDRLVAYPPEPR